MKQQHNQFKTSKDIEDAFENKLTLVAIFGIDDPLREGISEVIAKCKEAGVTLRLITSENLNCARATALKCGLITKEAA